MRNKKLLLIVSLLFLGACSRSVPVVVKPEAVYCPRPVRPALVEPRTVEDVLQNWLDTTEYSLAQDSVIQCYEEANKKK